MTSSGNEPRILGIGRWVNVDIERWQPCWFISWPRQENAPVNLGHQSTVHRMTNVALPDGFRGSTIGLRSHQRAPGEEGKARLGIGITSRQRCVESRLIDRPGADILSTCFPFRNHPLTNAQMCRKLPDAHPLRLAEYPNLNSRPTLNCSHFAALCPIQAVLPTASHMCPGHARRSPPRLCLVRPRLIGQSAD